LIGQLQEILITIGQALETLHAPVRIPVNQPKKQPLGTSFEKLAAFTQVFAENLNKKIEMTFSGEGILLPRTCFDALDESLLHLLRNACDHGIESPEQRKKAGKSETGKIQIHATLQEDQNLWVEVKDDGRGVECKKLLSTALDRGLISIHEKDSLSYHQILNLVFIPGLTTAKQITQISGRGVGMDIVKNNVAQMGGTVELESTPGNGMTVRIKVSLKNL
jgi:two-component system chemotaxis sensor kinase CheA